jgi:hypothetical protein
MPAVGRSAVCFNGVAKPPSLRTLSYKRPYSSHRWLPYGIFLGPRSSQFRTAPAGSGFGVVPLKPTEVGIRTQPERERLLYPE